MKTKRKISVPQLLAGISCIAIISVCGCATPSTHRIAQTNAGVYCQGYRLENGAYLILRQASTPEDARVEGRSHVVMAYDRRKYGNAPTNQPLEYVALDPTDYVPLIIDAAPEMKQDGRGKSILSVSLTRQSAERAETFTRAHLGGKIAMVVDGEIVTLHKIRSIITGGKLQITRCDDNACEVIRAKLVR
jgi:preprotein translocase subunit SecD